jgi:hypothetical protein
MSMGLLCCRSPYSRHHDVGCHLFRKAESSLSASLLVRLIMHPTPPAPLETRLKVKHQNKMSKPDGLDVKTYEILPSSDPEQR